MSTIYTPLKSENNLSFRYRLEKLKAMKEELEYFVESTPFAPYSRPVFIINDRVVTRDFDKIAIDRDAIYSILQFGPADIESLAKGVVRSGWQHTGPVSVIRIYVKDAATRQKARDAVRIG